MNKKASDTLKGLSYSELEDLRREIEERQSKTYRRYLITFEVIFKSSRNSSEENNLHDLEAFCDSFPDIIEDTFLSSGDKINILQSKETLDTFIEFNANE